MMYMFASISRIWWLIAFSLSLVMCIMGIIGIWDKWHQRPVIVSFNDKSTSIGMIPFPAVTICSTQKFTKETLNVERIFGILTAMEQNETAFLKFKPDE